MNYFFDFFQLVTMIGVTKYINKLTNFYNNIHDQISNIFKTFHQYLIEPITYIINSYFKTRTFPNISKQTTVVLLHKLGSKQLINNYRPIDITNVVNELIKNVLKIDW